VPAHNLEDLRNSFHVTSGNKLKTAMTNKKDGII
jgi:hypothetical protein